MIESGVINNIWSKYKVKPPEVWIICIYFLIISIDLNSAASRDVLAPALMLWRWRMWSESSFYWRGLWEWLCWYFWRSAWSSEAKEQVLNNSSCVYFAGTESGNQLINSKRTIMECPVLKTSSPGMVNNFPMCCSENKYSSQHKSDCSCQPEIMVGSTTQIWVTSMCTLSS